jgi:hypothetical protein
MALNNVLSVQQLFDGRVFRVPDYQRGYAWESRQRSEFLEDLEILGPKREHFTGLVVLHEQSDVPQKLDAEGKSYCVYDIVDGQQRLCTIVLLLDAIRRELASLRGETARTLADGIRRSYVAATDVSGQPLFKLTLNSDCDQYFRMVALSDQPGPEGPQISSERRLADTRSEFKAYLTGQRDEDEIDHQTWLTELYLKIVNQLRVSLYQVDTAGDVGVIFEVMNNRGKPLSELEKVKNYLLYASSTISLPHELDRVVNDAWAEIFRQLMAAGLTSSTDEDQLLRAHWLTFYNPQPRKWEGSKTITSRFDLRNYKAREEQLLGDLITYTEGLRASCVGYCDARAPERAEAFTSIPDRTTRSEVKRWSDKLIRTNVIASFLPLLIATRTRFADDAGKYLELVKFCEGFAFRVYRLLERRSNAGQAELFRVGHQLYKGIFGFDDAMTQLWRSLLAISPESTFIGALRRQGYWYGWVGLKYFLYEYEEHLAANRGAVPRISWDEVRRRERADSIEHVLPQTPRDPYWLDRFDDEERKTLTHDLGNLSLTKDNPSYGNKPFPVKKGVAGSGRPCYAESPYFMERELATFDDWNPDTLQARRNRLNDWAIQRWSVPAEVARSLVAEDVEAAPADDEYPDEDLQTDEGWA